jgi:hypothetical protein
MRGLVDKETATVALVAMPATEVVCDVRGVEHPLEMYACHRADCTGLQMFPHFGVVWCVAIVEDYAHILPGSFARIEDLSTAGSVDGHGFFNYDVTAQFKGADDVDVVGSVDGGDNDFVGLRLMNHENTADNTKEK